jgi:hypothetical protein
MRNGSVHAAVHSDWAGIQLPGRTGRLVGQMMAADVNILKLSLENLVGTVGD